MALSRAWRRAASSDSVAVISVGPRSLVISVDGAAAERELASLLATVRAMTADEYVDVAPHRLRFAIAPHAGTAGALQTELCAKPDDGRWVEDQARRVGAGDPVKCVEK